MKNKKFIWAVAVFFIFGFMAYAFANPFNKEEEPTKKEPKTPVVDKKPVVNPTVNNDPNPNQLLPLTTNPVTPNPIVILDTVAPVIKSVTLSEYEWTKQDVSVKVEATDNVALNTKAYSFDNGLTFQESNEFIVKNRSELKIIVKDAAGNLSETYHQVVLVDQVNPEKPTMSIEPIVDRALNLLLTETNPMGTMVNVVINPGLDLESGVKGVETSVDGITWTLSGTVFPYKIPYEESGDYTLYARTVDNVGNISVPEMISFSIDIDAPEVVSLTYSNTNPTRDNVVATIVTNEPVTIDGWTERANNTYTKEYTDNTSEVITLTDVTGNISTANIVISNIDREPINLVLDIVELPDARLQLRLSANKDLKPVVWGGIQFTYDSSSNIWSAIVPNTGSLVFDPIVEDLAGNTASESKTYNYNFNVDDFTVVGFKKATKEDKDPNSPDDYVVTLSFNYSDGSNESKTIIENLKDKKTKTISGSYETLTANGLVYVVNYSFDLYRNKETYTMSNKTVTAALKTPVV